MARVPVQGQAWLQYPARPGLATVPSQAGLGYSTSQGQAWLQYPSRSGLDSVPSQGQAGLSTQTPPGTLSTLVPTPTYPPWYPPRLPRVPTWPPPVHRCRRRHPCAHCCTAVAQKCVTRLNSLKWKYYLYCASRTLCNEHNIGRLQIP